MVFVVVGMVIYESCLVKIVNLLVFLNFCVLFFCEKMRWELYVKRLELGRFFIIYLGFFVK